MNLSNSSSCSCKWRNVTYSYIQIPFGLGAAITNLLIVLTIVRYRALRPQYYIICGLAFADFIEGLATFIAGVWRSTSLIQGWACSCISKFTCMLLPQMWMWRWSEITTAYMLLAVSCDRFYAIFYPLQYFNKVQGLSVTMIVIVYSLASLNMTVGFIYPFIERSTLMPAFCSSSAVFYKPYYLVNKHMGSFGSFMSVVVYGLVVQKFRKGRKIAASTTGNRKSQVERDKMAQWKLTRTLGISSLFTLLLDTIPRLYGSYIDVNKEANIFGSDSAYVFQLTKINAMANFFIYALRQQDLRKGLGALFKCKSMPPVLSLWTTKVSQRTRENIEMNKQQK